MTWALVQLGGGLLSAIGGDSSRRMLHLRPYAGSPMGTGCQLLVLAGALGGYAAGAGSARSRAKAATSSLAQGQPAGR